MPALTAGVGDVEVEARRAAIEALEALGRQAAPAGPALVAALADQDRFVRWAAARALGKIRPADVATLVPALAHLVADGDRDVALSALSALSAFGPRARAAVPALLEAAQTREPELRMAALRALESIGSEDAASLAVLAPPSPIPMPASARQRPTCSTAPPIAPGGGQGPPAPLGPNGRRQGRGQRAAAVRACAGRLLHCHS